MIMFSSALLLSIFFSSYLMCREYNSLRNETYTNNDTTPANYPEKPPAIRPRPLIYDDSFLNLPRPRPIEDWQNVYYSRPIIRPVQPRFVAIWRSAVNNLVQSATIHMSEAKRWLQLNNTGAAVLAACMGVEKMARALLHCYGIRPEQNYGQAEALRLLQAIAKENQNERFQEKIGLVEKITAAKASMELRLRSQTATDFPDKTAAEQMFSEAANIIQFYKQIIQEKFATEL